MMLRMEVRGLVSLVPSYLAVAFPLIAVWLPRESGLVFSLLLLWALVVGWQRWRLAAPEEVPVIIGFGAVLATALLSLSVATHHLDLGWQKLERIFHVSATGLLFLALRPYASRVVRHLPLIALLAAISCGFLAWIDVHLDHALVAQGMYDKLIFGATSAVNCSLLLAAWTTIIRRPGAHAACAVAMGAGLYALLASQARGAWLTLPAVLALAAWLNRQALYRHRIAWGSAFLSAFLLFAAPHNPVTSQVVLHFKQGFADLAQFQQDPALETSWGIRLNLWRDAVMIWGEHPLLGTGPGDLHSDNQLLWEKGRALAPPFDTDHAHSIYFDSLATFGTVGLVLIVVGLFVLPFRRLYSTWTGTTEGWVRFSSLAGLCVLVVFLVFGLSEGWLARIAYVNHYALLVALLWAGASADERDH